MNSNNFFLDIFNKLLKINEDNIMIIFDVYGDIWFKFKDVLIALGYSDIKHTISEMKIMNNNKIHYSNIKVVGSTPPPYNFQKNTMFINESCQIKIFRCLFGNNTLSEKIFDFF